MCLIIIGLRLIPYNNSESFLHVGKSEPLQMLGLQLVYGVVDHPNLYTFIKRKYKSKQKSWAQYAGLYGII